MKHLHRRLFDLAAGVSAVLLGVGFLIWVIVPYGPTSLGLGFNWQPGAIGGKAWLIDNSGAGVRAFIDLDPAFKIPPKLEGVHHRMGFWFEMFDPGPGRPMIVLVVPAWLCLLVAAVLPLRWVFLDHRRRLRQRRLAAGLCIKCGHDVRATNGRCPECEAMHCPRCGYDLRATPQRCPECGTMVTEVERKPTTGATGTAT